MPERPEGFVVKVVLDVLKRVDVSIVEVDANTETVKLVVEGHGISLEDVEAVVKRLGAAIHSVDQVVVEKR
jgi:hypothetical protein